MWGRVAKATNGIFDWNPCLVAKDPKVPFTSQKEGTLWHATSITPTSWPRSLQPSSFDHMEMNEHLSPNAPSISQLYQMFGPWHLRKFKRSLFLIFVWLWHLRYTLYVTLFPFKLCICTTYWKLTYQACGIELIVLSCLSVLFSWRQTLLSLNL